VTSGFGTLLLSFPEALDESSNCEVADRQQTHEREGREEQNDREEHRLQRRGDGVGPDDGDDEEFGHEDRNRVLSESANVVTGHVPKARPELCRSATKGLHPSIRDESLED
jgi:hypothetical protein